MNFIPVKELPKQHKRTFSKRNGDHLREFLNLGIKYAKMDITDMDYVNTYSAYTSTKTLIKHHCLPIEARFINQELYLVNTELE